MRSLSLSLSGVSEGAEITVDKTSFSLAVRKLELALTVVILDILQGNVSLVIFFS